MPTTAAFDHVTLHDVSRNFGRRRALTRVSMSCRAGEVVGLLGPNGAGKSTLLALLATLIAPSSGDIRYGDRTAAELGAGLRGAIGLLAHDLYLYPELSGRENLEFFGRLYGLADARERAQAALERARLAERGDEPVAGFSRGMRQRLALERTLLHDPRLVLLDEPFTGLDEASTGLLLVRLKQLRADGRLVLIATHDLDLVDGLLDRAAVFRDGRLISIGPCGESVRSSYRARIGG